MLRRRTRYLPYYKRARIPLAVFCTLLLIASSAPYLLGFGREADSAWQFTGFTFGVEDGHSYLAKMRQGGRGDFQFRLFYTTEPHAGASLIFWPYMLTGWLVGRVIPESDPRHTDALIVGFHTLRVICAGLLLAALWRFIGAFIRAPRPRLIAFVLACAGGGLGWLITLAGWTDALGAPPEFYIPEGFGWLPIYGLPHIALGRAALLTGLLIVIGAERRSTADRRDRPPVGRATIAAAVCWIVVGLCVPFYLAILYVIAAAWTIGAAVRTRALPWPLILRLAVPIALTLPLFGYYALAFIGDPALARWSAQNILQSPAPLLYAIAYGPLAILALIGARTAWRRAGRRGQIGAMLLLAWPVIVPVLVYLPINVQRRMSEAVIVPLAILAAYALERLNRNWGSALIAWVLCFSTLLLWGSGLFTLGLAPPERPLFIRSADVAALDWLHQHSEPGAAALSMHITGNVLPAYTHLRSYVGLGTETIAYEWKKARAAAFFSGTLTPADAAALLAGDCLPDDPRLCGDPIAYIVRLTPELAADSAGAFTVPPGWSIVYQGADGVTIYGR